MQSTVGFSKWPWQISLWYWSTYISLTLVRKYSNKLVAILPLVLVSPPTTNYTQLKDEILA